MSSGFNDNTYEVLKTVKYRDVFNKISVSIGKGTLIGSATVNALIVEEDTDATEGQDYIDYMVSLGYVKIST